MALLFMDGFDKYTAGTGQQDELQRFWVAIDAQINIESSLTGRHGNYASLDAGGNMQSKTFSPTDNVGVIGFAYMPDTVTSTNDFLRINEGATTHLTVDYLGGPGTLRVIRGTSTVLETSTASLSPSPNWNWIEFKWTIHDTTGAYELRLNGATVASGSGVDTQNGGTAAWDNFEIESLNGSVDSHVDDLYLLDSASSGVTGAPNNDFLGDIRIDTLHPDGNGNSSQLTGQDADSTNNYLNVDDSPGPDDDTTYNESATVSDQDTYTLDNMPAAAQDDILAIQVNLVAKHNDAGPRSMRTVIRDGGTDYYGTTTSLGATYDGITQIEEGDNPGGGTTQWTETNVNALEAGADIVA